ncbi:MAG: hypothetical protein ACM3MD_00880 [Betaproteobacteria bacterium]
MQKVNKIMKLGVELSEVKDMETTVNGGTARVILSPEHQRTVS